MDHYSDGPSHFTVEKGPGRTVIFLRELFREVDIGIHAHEIGHPQRLRFDIEVSIPGSEPPKSDKITDVVNYEYLFCLLYTSPSPRDATLSRMPSSA